eukprot:Skav228742  [mRNA]  locus=scaffold655:350883:351359:- [translate_table: standard]
MGFVHDLKKTAESARQKVVKGTIQKFKAKCAAEARKGHFSCSLLVNYEDCSRDHAPLVRKELVEMGFGDVEIETAGYTSFFKIKAGWSNVKSEEPEKTGKEAQGTSRTCPVCFEHRQVVALTPCGHVVCQQCQGSHRFCRCPMCRVDVTGATRALFLE